MIKNMIIMISLVFSLQANAGLGWFLLGAALNDKPAPPKIEELQIQINKINSTLPRLCPNARKNSGCWSQFKTESLSFSVSNEKKNELKSYYINSGYNVSLDNNTLVFDFKEEHQKYLYWKTLFISEETYFILGIFGLVFFFFLKIYWNGQKRIKNIKLAYENSKNDLMFWEKDGAKILEESLKNNRTPLYWNFSIENNKIIGITEYNGRSIGRIASRRDDLYNSLKGLGLINLDARLKSVKEK